MTHPDRELPSVSQLQVLMAVAATGSLSRAAAELGRTQSAVSFSLDALERILGTPLTVRRKAGTQLTEDGRAVLEKAREVLVLLEAMSAVGRSRRIEGRVRLSCFRSVATHVFPFILGELSRTYPEVVVEINDACFEPQDVEEEVLSGRSHLGIGHWPSSGNLLNFPILFDEYGVVIAKGALPPGPLSWAALSGHPYIQLDSYGTREIVDYCRSQGFSCLPRFQLREDSTILAMVASRIGFSILPRLAVEPLPEGIEFRALPTSVRRTLGVLHLRATGALPPVAAVAQVLRTPAVLARIRAVRTGLVSLVPAVTAPA